MEFTVFFPIIPISKQKGGKERRREATEREVKEGGGGRKGEEISEGVGKGRGGRRRKWRKREGMRNEGR